MNPPELEVDDPLDEVEADEDAPPPPALPELAPPPPEPAEAAPDEAPELLDEVTGGAPTTPLTVITVPPTGAVSVQSVSVCCAAATACCALFRAVWLGVAVALPPPEPPALELVGPAGVVLLLDVALSPLEPVAPPAAVLPLDAPPPPEAPLPDAVPPGTAPPEPLVVAPGAAVLELPTLGTLELPLGATGAGVLGAGPCPLS